MVQKVRNTENIALEILVLVVKCGGDFPLEWMSPEARGSASLGSSQKSERQDRRQDIQALVEDESY